MPDFKYTTTMIKPWDYGFYAYVKGQEHICCWGSTIENAVDRLEEEYNLIKSKVHE